MSVFLPVSYYEVSVEFMWHGSGPPLSLITILHTVGCHLWLDTRFWWSD